MADEFTAHVLSRLEEVVPVRPAFADALRLQLHRELGFAPATATIAAVRPTAAPRRTAQSALEPPFWARFRPSFRPLSLRVALLTALALMLLAGTVVAVYLVARAWLSAGDRGPQFTSDFWLSEAFSQPDAMYLDIRIAPNGSSLLAFRQPLPSPWGSDQIDPTEWAIVRIPLDGSGQMPETVLPLEEIRRSIAWDPGTDVEAGFVRRSPTAITGDGLSVAANGDVFASVSIGSETGPPASSALVVVHPDGTVEKIATVRELADAGLLGPLTSSNGRSIAGTASAPDRIWARAEADVEGGPAGSAFWLFEITDPDADGHWSDRVVRPLALPSSVPAVEYGQYDWLYESFVAEPTLTGHDRSHSVLVPFVNHDDEYRLYRIADWNDDGDAFDAGEADLIFSGTGGPDVTVGMTGPVVAPRVVLEGTRVALDEQVIGGLTRTSRVSRLTAEGLVDILRALPTPISAVATTGDGSIYAASQREAASDSGWEYVIYRLTPVEVGATPPPGAITPNPSFAPPSHPNSTPTALSTQQTPSSTPNGSPPAATPTSTPQSTSTPRATPPEGLGIDPQPVTQDVDQILFELSRGTEVETMLIGVDGSGPQLLLSGLRPADPCLSTDGTKMAFLSDAEVPNEYYVYVAGSDGRDVVKVSEDIVGFECPFEADSIVLWRNGQQLYFRHDLPTDQEELVLEGNSGFVSPNGRLLMTMPGPATLSVVNVRTGSDRQVAGPFDAEIGPLNWSPDSRMIALGVSRTGEDNADGENDIYVADASGDRERLLTTTHGLMPDMAWSSDSSKLALLVPSEMYRPDGTYKIVLVDMHTGEVTTIADTGAKWVAWSPTDPSTLAYATPDELVVIENGEARSLLTAPSERPDDWWQWFWLGWSPDGRYIGRYGPDSISLVDVTTASETVIWTDPEGTSRRSTMWWR